MKIFALTALLTATLTAGFAPRPLMTSSTRSAGALKAEVFDQEQYIAQSKEMRLKHLEEQSMFALKIAVENYGNAVFPNALIAGDVVITHLLDRMDT
jgi:phosphoadenosine phosphosulfate reductase